MTAADEVGVGDALAKHVHQLGLLAVSVDGDVALRIGEHVENGRRLGRDSPLYLDPLQHGRILACRGQRAVFRPEIDRLSPYRPPT